MTTRPAPHRAALPALVVLLVAALAGCGSDTSADAPDGDAPSTDGPVASAAWARPTRGAVTTGAAYLTIESDRDDVLVGVAVGSELAGSASIHETVVGEGHDDHDDHDHATHGHDTDGHDMTTMRAVDEVPIPAGEPVRFEPGGLHLMLEELVAPLEAGTTFELTLTFRDAGTRSVEVQVRDEAP